MSADFERVCLRIETNKEGNGRNDVRLDGLETINSKSVEIRLQEIAKNATKGGKYVQIGKLYGFPLLVKTESILKDGMVIQQNRFFVEGAFKYTYNNRQAAMNFLNALERIPKLIEQYRTQNVAYERDIPILQETVGAA